MRVLQVHTPYRQRGGEDAVVEREAALLRSDGHHVEQFLEPNPTSPVGVAVRLPVAPWNPLSARALSRRLRDETPDVCHIHNTWYALSPSVVRSARSTGVPTVMTLHNYRLVCANGLLYRDGKPCETCLGTHPWAAVRYGCYHDSRIQSVVSAATIDLNRRRETWLRGIDRFVVMTEFARRLLVSAGFPPHRIIVKPHFVDDPGPRANPPSASRSVLFVGRLTPEKGVDMLLDVWRRTRLEGLELLIVGDGPERARLEAQRRQGVRFLGAQTPLQVRDLMMGARALVVPSKWYETFGLVAAEGFAAGLPLVASRIGAIGEMAAWVPNACIPAPGDLDEWGTALSRLLDDATVDGEGAVGRSLYEERLTPRAGLDNLLRVYEAVATGPVGPPRQR